MRPVINLAEVDVDGAIGEAAHEATDALERGDSRLSFLKKAGLAGGAVMSGGAILSALAPAALALGGGRPPASFGAGDVGILNYALTLEYLESAFYNEATAKGKIHDSQTRAFLKTTTKDENAHVQALKSALGSKAAKKPKFDFKGTTGSQALFQKTAYVLENTGVHAYSGQALNIKSPAVVATALSIVTVEARHASVIGLILNGGSAITPSGPFDTTLTAAQVLAAVKSTGFIVG